MSERLREISLASASPRRLELLRSLGLGVTVIASAYSENGAAPAREPSAIALAHAKGKADAAAPSGPPVLVAADTIVVIDGEVLGKPRDAADAGAMLHRLSGREHRVYTGFAVQDRASGRRAAGVESAAVRFRALDDALIARYVATGEPMDKAGAYAIQGYGSLLVESIDGDFYCVMGLPLVRVARACAELGYELL